MLGNRGEPRALTRELFLPPPALGGHGGLVVPGTPAGQGGVHPGPEDGLRPWTDMTLPLGRGFYHSGNCQKLSQKDSAFSILSSFFLKVSQMNGCTLSSPLILTLADAEAELQADKASLL